jgi:hypothetical protein
MARRAASLDQPSEGRSRSAGPFTAEAEGSRAPTVMKA